MSWEPHGESTADRECPGEGGKGVRCLGALEEIIWDGKASDLLSAALFGQRHRPYYAHGWAEKGGGWAEDMFQQGVCLGREDDNRGGIGGMVSGSRLRV